MVATLKEIKAKNPDVSINIVQSITGVDGSRYDKSLTKSFQNACDNFANNTSAFEYVREMAIILWKDAEICKANKISKPDLGKRMSKIFEPIIASTFPDNAKPSMTITRLKFIGKNMKHVDFLFDNFKNGNQANLDDKFVKLGVSFGAIGTFKNKLASYIAEAENKPTKEVTPLTDKEKAVNAVARAIADCETNEEKHKLIASIGILAVSKSEKKS